MFQDPDHVIETDDYEEEEKLSALIRRAVDGYDKLDGNKFKFTSNKFFSIKRDINKNSTTCVTCLAGSLVSFIEQNTTKITFSNRGYGHFYDLYEKMDMFYDRTIPEELKAIGVTPSIVRGIIALECVRKGHISEAISYHEMLSKNVVPPDMQDDTIESHTELNWYYDNPEWKEDYNRYKPIMWYSKKMWKEDARGKILHRADLLEAAGY